MAKLEDVSAKLLKRFGGDSGTVIDLSSVQHSKANEPILSSFVWRRWTFSILRQLLKAYEFIDLKVVGKDTVVKLVQLQKEPQSMRSTPATG